MLLDSIRRLLQRRPPQPSSAGDLHRVERAGLMQLMPACPVCKDSLRRHSFLTLAEAGTVEDTVKLLQALAMKSWTEVAEIHSFAGDQNAFLAKAIRCGSLGFTITIFDESELEGVSAVVGQQILNAAEWSGLQEHFKHHPWRTI